MPKKSKRKTRKKAVSMSVPTTNISNQGTATNSNIFWFSNQELYSIGMDIIRKFKNYHFFSSLNVDEAINKIVTEYQTKEPDLKIDAQQVQKLIYENAKEYEKHIGRLDDWWVQESLLEFIYPLVGADQLDQMKKEGKLQNYFVITGKKGDKFTVRNIHQEDIVMDFNNYPEIKDHLEIGVVFENKSNEKERSWELILGNQILSLKPNIDPTQNLVSDFMQDSFGRTMVRPTK